MARYIAPLAFDPEEKEIYERAAVIRFLGWECGFEDELIKAIMKRDEIPMDIVRRVIRKLGPLNAADLLWRFTRDGNQPRRVSETVKKSPRASRRKGQGRRSFGEDDGDVERSIWDGYR